MTERILSGMNRRVIQLPLLVLIGFAIVETAAVVSFNLFSDKLEMFVRYRALLNSEPERRIQLPIRSVRRSDIADTWGARRGADRKHEGQDIFAPKGTPIYSATDGYVYSIGENPLGGKTVRVVGAGGRVYYYAHLEAYGDMKENDPVSPNTILGYVGTSGNAAGTPPHLHFGVYTFSGPINPLTLF